MVASHCFPDRPCADILTFARVRVILGAGILMFAACADEPIPTDPSAIDSAGVSPTASEQPIDAAAAQLTGFRLREQVGRLDLTEAGGSEAVTRPPYGLTKSADAEELRRASLQAQRRASELGLVASVMLADADGNLYADFVDPGVAYAAPRGRGFAPASDTPRENDDFAPKGFSHGVDNRLFLGTGSWFWDSHSAFRRIGDLSEPGAYADVYCTGALFGRRLVFTRAANCAFYGTTGSLRWTKTIFAPRRRGSNYPYGSSRLAGVIWPVAFTANDCHYEVTWWEAETSKTCRKYDFAVLILPKSPQFTTHPGWMGFVFASDATTASWLGSNVGYPRCQDNPDEPFPSPVPPANCKYKEPYGDLFCSFVTPKFSWGSTSNAWPFGNGANPVISTGCDTSHGHQGGPIYTYSAGSNGPYIIGNQTYELCIHKCEQLRPTYSTSGVRINSTLGNWMLSLRQSVYP